MPDASELNEMGKLLEILMKDVDVAGDLAGATGSPVARRAFARAVFAWMEGNLCVMRAVLLATCKHLLSDGERVVLEEVSYELDARAQVVERPKHPKFEQSFN